jgi:eukaryotic-like serine/threonine-protein kinase
MESPPNMDPEVWRQLDALLSEALTLSEPERERWLSELPEEDRPLAASLREMLSRSLSTGFLRDPVSAEVLAAAGEQALEQPGARIGPYRLLRGLGVGGMGQVWLAERVDGTPRRQVALKLPRTSWAPGMAERLKQERDALAALEHPSIARLYDAGTTEEGRPYIAMEYVDGVPIDAYARAHGLSLRQRLALFLQVAGAVSHAHAHLVVHRDLKASNILVSETQGVRLLDFGAAKLLQEEGPGDSELTREMGPALSPDYASPEQIRGERVSVATDVYSLGVVLYELVTGQRPYRLSRESWAALVESVGRLEVPAASSRVRDDARLARALRGDLDAVLAKALRRAATERYGSVQAFADDVTRFLSGEPVRAKQQTVGERVWKFARRNSLAVGTAAGVTLLVGGAAGVALWQAKVARGEARRAERVRQFIASILTSATPRTGVGGVVTASDLLTAAADRIEKELSVEPAIAAELGFLVAQSFDNLGEDSKEEPVLRAAVARAEASFGRSHLLTLQAKALLAEVLALHDVPGSLALSEELLPESLRGLPATVEVAILVLRDKSFALAKLNRVEESYSALREAIQLGEKYLGRLDARTISALELLANTYHRFEDVPNEMATATDAVERARQAFGAQRPHNILLACERTYAEALLTQGRPGDAATILRGVLADQKRLDSAETMRVQHAKLRLGFALQLSGRLGEGLSLIREAVALERTQNPADSDDRAGYAGFLAGALAAAERVDEWMAQEDELSTIMSRVGRVPHGAELVQRIRKARLAALLGRSAEVRLLVADVESKTSPKEVRARSLAEVVSALDARLQLRLPEALERLEGIVNGPKLAALPRRAQAEVAAELGTVRLDLGDLSGAEQELERCREVFVGVQMGPSIPMTTCLVGAARLRLGKGRFAEAEEILLPLAAAWEQVNPEGSGRGVVLHWLTRAEDGLGKRAAARRDARLADALLSRSTLPALRRLVDRPAR